MSFQKAGRLQPLFQFCSRTIEGSTSSAARKKYYVVDMQQRSVYMADATADDKKPRSLTQGDGKGAKDTPSDVENIPPDPRVTKLKTRRRSKYSIPVADEATVLEKKANGNEEKDGLQKKAAPPEMAPAANNPGGMTPGPPTKSKRPTIKKDRSQLGNFDEPTVGEEKLSPSFLAKKKEPTKKTPGQK